LIKWFDNPVPWNDNAQKTQSTQVAEPAFSEVKVTWRQRGGHERYLTTTEAIHTLHGELPYPGELE